MKTILLASSPTLEGITKLVSDYFMGSSITIVGEAVHNKRGRVVGVRVVEKGGRFRFEQI